VGQGMTNPFLSSKWGGRREVSPARAYITGEGTANSLDRTMLSIADDPLLTAWRAVLKRLGHDPTGGGSSRECGGVGGSLATTLRGT